eukprot:TRINITY_DN2008_c0_g1_i41.p2 TRINITY_DN2008_c0_g1~~TRINITY_DN2008_c0_g1_i41.p2  ORF type:complete len:137 (+),score=18.64 TRINITY_DN2008_c0_g1_i41:66-476(+)
MYSNPLLNHTRQPRKPHPACVPAHAQQPFVAPYPTASEASASLHSNPSLSGTIPDSLGSLSHLQELYMHSNPLLSGTIPDSLGSLPSIQLVDLLMHSNPSLSGTIPDSLGILDQLVHLDMHSNPSLSGTIPDTQQP